MYYKDHLSHWSINSNEMFSLREYRHCINFIYSIITWLFLLFSQVRSNCVPAEKVSPFSWQMLLLFYLLLVLFEVNWFSTSIYISIWCNITLSKIQRNVAHSKHLHTNRRLPTQCSKQFRNQNWLFSWDFAKSSPFSVWFPDTV